MADEGIVPGLVKTRRRMYSPNEKNGVVENTSVRLEDVNDSIKSLKWRMRKHDSDAASIKNQLHASGKTMDDLQVKVNLLQSLTANLYAENQELLTAMKEVRSELSSLAHRECVIHSDNVASIWKS